MASPVAVLLVVVICIGLSAAEVPVDCCLKVTDRQFPRKFEIVSYTLQEAGKGCDVSATVVMTKSGHRLCVPHPSQKKWVKDFINRTDKNRAPQ